MNIISDVSEIGNACFSGQGAKFASSNPRGYGHRWIIVFGCPAFNSIKYLVTCSPPTSWVSHRYCIVFPIAIVLCSILPSCTAP